MWVDELRQLIDPNTILITDHEIRRYSYDAWPVATKWRKQAKQPYKPDVVVRATDAEQIRRILRWASEKRVPVTPWGAGSSVTGAPLPVRGGIVLDLSGMNRIDVIDETNLLVRVQAGVKGGHLERVLNEHGYTLNHSPQSLHRSTVGGWIATRATGQFSSRWGSIEDLLLGFTVVLPTGEIVSLRSMPRAAVGPDLRHLVIGAEGTMGVVIDATLKIFPMAEHRILQTIAFDTIDAGVSVMREVMRVGLRPFLVRFYDEYESSHAMQDENFHRCVMFLGVEGVKRVTEAEYAALMEICRTGGGSSLGADPVEAWMKRRFDFAMVENILATPGGYAETIEIAHFWDKILETYYGLRIALAPLADETLGHFSHVYPQGSSLYMILLGHVEDDAVAEARIMGIWETAMNVCLDTGAAISHHHGVGLARQPYIQADLESEFIMLKRLKAGFDPGGIMNPGKLGLD